MRECQPITGNRRPHPGPSRRRKRAGHSHFYRWFFFSGAITSSARRTIHAASSPKSARVRRLGKCREWPPGSFRASSPRSTRKAHQGGMDVKPEDLFRRERSCFYRRGHALQYAGDFRRAMKDDVSAALGNQRGMANELKHVAAPLLDVQEQRAAGDVFAAPLGFAILRGIFDGKSFSRQRPFVFGKAVAPPCWSNASERFHAETRFGSSRTARSRQTDSSNVPASRSVLPRLNPADPGITPPRDSIRRSRAGLWIRDRRRGYSTFVTG